jgi:hypothetical protein
LAEGCNDVFFKLAELFQKLAKLFWCTGRKTISGLATLVVTPVPATLETGKNRAGIHKRFSARKKTGSELIFLRFDFKISFFPFLQILFTNNVSVWRIFFKKIDCFEKN